MVNFPKCGAVHQPEVSGVVESLSWLDIFKLGWLLDACQGLWRTDWHLWVCHPTVTLVVKRSAKSDGCGPVGFSPPEWVSKMCGPRLVALMLQDQHLQICKRELNLVKNKLNDFDLANWHKHTRHMNLAGEVLRTLRNEFCPEFITQASFKLWLTLKTRSSHKVSVIIFISISFSSNYVLTINSFIYLSITVDFVNYPNNIHL